MNTQTLLLEVYHSRLARVALAVVCAASVMRGSASAQTYTVQDLGTLGGDLSFGLAINNTGQVAGASRVIPNTPWHGFVYGDGVMTELTFGGISGRGVAINAKGEVTGEAAAPDGRHRAFKYSGGTMLDLGDLGGLESLGTAINDAGQVTGYAYLPGDEYPYHAFLFSNGMMADLGTLGGSFSTGAALNASGQVTGIASFAGDVIWHALLYSNGVMSDLGTLDGNPNGRSAGQAINDSGDVTGYSTHADGYSHAFVYRNGVMSDLGSLGGTASIGLFINAAGQVTGTSFTTGNAATHAFLYSGGVMTDIGTLGGGTYSRPWAINAAGQVTGLAKTNTGEDRAFLFSGGILIDLNTRIPADSGWTLNFGTAINDRGQITGGGLINGELHAFLLTPVATRTASVQQPIDADGSSVFNGRRGVIPVKFTLIENGIATCQLPAATIAVTRTAGGTVGAIDENVYAGAADSGSNFRISDCQYLYNLSASALGPGRYRVDLSIDGTVVGTAEFSLK